MTEEVYKKYDEYEKTLRRILCIFQSVESMLICLTAVSLMGYFDSKLLYYRISSLSSVISLPLIVGVIFLGASFLSWKYEKIFKIWEWTHAVLAIIVVLYVMCFAFEIIFNLLIILLIMTWRLVVYKKLMKRYYRKKIVNEYYKGAGDEY